MITSYEAKNLNEIDKKLLKGLYENKVYDVEDGKDRIIMCIKKYILQKVNNMKREYESKHQITSTPRLKELMNTNHTKN